MASSKKRVVLFGTHPHQFNGYSKVVYHLTRALEQWRGGETGDIDTHVFGFQNFYNNPAHDRVLQRTKVYDPFALEEPRQQGFGFGLVQAYAESVRPDLCVVYNDMCVVSNVVSGLVKARESCGYPRSIAVYLDQVYDSQKPHFVQLLNQYADAVIVFGPYWETCIRRQGIRPDMPMHVLPHGFDPSRNFPIPKEYARMYLGLGQDDFVVLNLNRNQPRKRWDVCVKAMCKWIARHSKDPVKFIVATSATTGAWDLNELFFMEFRKNGMSMADGMAHIVTMDKPQLLADEDINILYNACDVGINTCDGEGFGLCNFEQAGVGVPQIVPRIGGFNDIFDDNCAILVDPVVTYYVDSSRDSVGGEASMCRDADFVDALEKYYADPDLRRRHGKAARERVLRNFSWPDVAHTYEQIVDACLGSIKLEHPVEATAQAPTEATAQAPTEATAQAPTQAPTEAKLVAHDDPEPTGLEQEKHVDKAVDAQFNNVNQVDRVDQGDQVSAKTDPPEKRVHRHPRKHAHHDKRSDKHGKVRRSNDAAKRPRDLDDVEAECRRLLRRLRKLRVQ